MMHPFLQIQPQGTTLNMAMDLDRLVVLSANPPSYPTFDALLNACKKTLNISKTSRYLPYKVCKLFILSANNQLLSPSQGTSLPISMPTETKATGGTQINKPNSTAKKEKEKQTSKKLGK